MNTRLFIFAGAEQGVWRVVNMRSVIGESLPVVARLNICDGEPIVAIAGTKWLLRGVTSNDRYVTRPEKQQLLAKQPALNRPTATCAALIPIRKNAEWWSLTQDERRAIFEERSLHVKTGLKYLPAIARRLHHCRDLGVNEPFDFLTWFEYAPADAQAFEDLVAELRASEEWRYVDREVDIRLQRDPV
jgi:hypothetical protein